MRSCELSIAALRRAYRNGSKTPRRVLTELLDACAAAPDGIWISLIDREQLEVRLAGLEASSPEELPLYGIPFAVKDNIDVAGLPTTAGCPDCSYRPERSARVVELLIEAGAVPLGKTNMDQFATVWSACVLLTGRHRTVWRRDMFPADRAADRPRRWRTICAVFLWEPIRRAPGRVPAAFNELVESSRAGES